MIVLIDSITILRQNYFDVSSTTAITSHKQTSYSHDTEFQLLKLRKIKRLDSKPCDVPSI